MNIELHSFPDRHADDLVKAIWDRLIGSSKVDWKDCCVTRVQSTATCANGRLAPYFRVYSDKQNDFAVAIEILGSIPLKGAGIRVGVECILLNSYSEL